MSASLLVMLDFLKIRLTLNVSRVSPRWPRIGPRFSQAGCDQGTAKQRLLPQRVSGAWGCIFNDVDAVLAQIVYKECERGALPYEQGCAMKTKQPPGGGLVNGNLQIVFDLA